MKTFKTIIGIDVSKDVLDMITLSGQDQDYQQWPNTRGSVLSWINSLDKSATLCVLEPTGAYHCRLLHYLKQHHIAVSMVNPSQSNGYVNACGIISKNDRQAALTLAMMGKSLDLPLYNHPDLAMQKRKQLLLGLNALKKQQQMLKNQLHALDHQIIFELKVVLALQSTLSTVEQQVLILEQELNELSDDEYDQQIDLIESVVGIGPKSAQLLIASTGGIQYFKRPRQLSKFIGLVPCSHYSGSSIRKKGRITKKGNKALRACLYMAARSAKKHNLACKALYERLRAKGKPHKQAMVAVMNKLVKQVFGVVHSGVSFDNRHYLKFCDI